MENDRRQDVDERGVDVDGKGRIHNLFAAWRPESLAIEAAIANYRCCSQVCGHLVKVEGRGSVKMRVVITPFTGIYVLVVSFRNR